MVWAVSTLHSPLRLVRREEGISPSSSSTSQGRHQEIAGPVQGRQLRSFLTPWSNGHPAVGPVPPRGMGWPAGGLQLICKLLLRATEESALFCPHNQVK